jgi:hypothetical protein
MSESTVFFIFYAGISLFLIGLCYFNARLNASNQIDGNRIKKMQYIRASLALMDTISDIQFAYRISKTKYLNLFWSSIAFSFISISASFVAVISLLLKRKPYLEIILKHTLLYFILAILSLTDLELLCFLPWKYKFRSLVNADGFPDKQTVLITSLTVILENIPQIAIQSVYLYSIEASDYVTIFSVVISSLSSISKLFRIFIVFNFAQVHDVNSNPEILPGNESLVASEQVGFTKI